MARRATRKSGTRLRFTGRHMIDFGTGSLLVEAVQDGEPLTCRVSSTALVEKAGATPGDEQSLWAACRRIAPDLQRAAARKQAAGERAPDGSIFIAATDLD
jgi:hypothetical protein